MQRLGGEGVFGELIAAGATVATLVYLATQIRQNTRPITNRPSASPLQRLVMRHAGFGADPENLRVPSRSRVVVRRYLDF